MSHTHKHMHMRNPQTPPYIDVHSHSHIHVPTHWCAPERQIIQTRVIGGLEESPEQCVSTVSLQIQSSQGWSIFTHLLVSDVAVNRLWAKLQIKMLKCQRDIEIIRAVYELWYVRGWPASSQLHCYCAGDCWLPKQKGRSDWSGKWINSNQIDL